MKLLENGDMATVGLIIRWDSATICRMEDIGSLRREYSRAGLNREDLCPKPIDQFRLWFEQAREAGVDEPNALSLATVDERGRPSQRMVLLKAFDEKGLVFFTNYRSRKAKHLAENAAASILFPWIQLERQLIVEGDCEKISTLQSLKYFSSRPRGSRLGAWVSDQSSVISSRKILEMKLEEMKRKFGEGEIPLPDFWGGFRLKPRRFEFWQGRPSRLHDRFEYVKDEKGDWTTARLSP
ncbi:pyridoxamine 5'-phosphate oxidase [Puniceicoccus vermicola]|nr:pyridoxamine 5'-phosphate oxidase [Puniceicoccus vermicola]